MTAYIRTSLFLKFSNQYGASLNYGIIKCYLNGDMHLNLYGKRSYFQQPVITIVTINSVEIGIGCTPAIPLQISTYTSHKKNI